MNTKFYYSVDMVSKYGDIEWERGYKLDELRRMKEQPRKALVDKLSKEVTKARLSQWVLSGGIGFRSGELHHVYIAFNLSWLFTRTGRKRDISRALKMMGVPFIKIALCDNGEFGITPDGVEEVIDIGNLTGILT